MKIPFYFAFAYISLFLSSCIYKNNDSRLGDLRTIYIEVVQNNSLAPQIGPLLNNKIRAHIIQRSHFRLTSEIRDSDLILRISLKNYRQSPEIYNPQDTLLAAGFNLSIGAQISLTNRRGKAFIEDVVLTDNASVLRNGSFSVPSDRQALLSLSESLGQQISQLIENFRW